MLTSRAVVATAGLSALLGVTTVTPSPAAVSSHGRPWHTHLVPASITSDCSKPVDARIGRWLMRLPSHSIAMFASGGCYGQTGTITVTGRHDLVIDGNGAKFRDIPGADDTVAMWRIDDGNRITVRHLHLIGPDTAARSADPPYRADLEWQHGIQLLGSRHITLSNDSIVDVWGDGIAVRYDRRGTPTRSVPSGNILVDHVRIDGTGRHGVGLTDVVGFMMRNSSIGNNRWESIDVEPAVAQEVARDIKIKRNTFGANRLGMFANYGVGDGDHQGHMSIVDNIETATPTTCRPQISLSTPGGEKRRSHYKIAGNHLVSLSNAIQANAVNHLNVLSNQFETRGSRSLCGIQAGIALQNIAHATVEHNVFGVNNDRPVDQVNCRLVQIAHNVVKGAGDARYAP